MVSLSPVQIKRMSLKRVAGFLVVLLVCLQMVISVNAGPSILVIGDSNTEKGMLTGALQKMFCDTFGYTGSGYFSLSPNWEGQVPYAGYSPIFQVDNGNGFLVHDCYQDYKILEPPYPAPNGIWLTSSTVNATVSVPFVGQSLDVYYASSVTGGAFEVRVDDVAKATVNTRGVDFVTHKATVTGLSGGTHTLKLVVTSAGTITLQGLDVIPNATGNNKRAVVHNWGNSWITSKQLLDANPATLRSALAEVNPDLTIVMIGTNDWGFNMLAPDKFQTNLVTYINRIKQALPLTPILLMSPISRCIQYLDTAYPQAAAITNVNYWDMFTWANPDWKTAGDKGEYGYKTYSDGLHFTADGGQAVAVELWKQIKLAMDKTMAPVVAPLSSVFTDSIVVSIQCGTTDATLRYTLDNSNPLSSSTAYTGPITIKSTTTLKVASFKTGKDPSATITTTYTKIPANSITKIRYYARSGYLFRMVGGIFEGTSGDPATGPYTTLYTIGNECDEGKWNEITEFTTIDQGYRYVRYRSPNGSYGNIAEIEIYRNNSDVKLSGTPFGTPGSWNNSGLDFTKVFDGDVSTYFDYHTQNGAYCGLDLGLSTFTAPFQTHVIVANRDRLIRATVYSFDGKVIGSIDNSSEASISRALRSSFAPGLYLVKMGNRSISIKSYRIVVP